MRFGLPFSRRRSGSEREPASPVDPIDPIDIVRAYHDATRHHEHAFARAPGTMDWDTQPDPFRRYRGARLIELDHVPLEGGPAYAQAFVEGAAPAAPVDKRSVSQLFGDAFGLTAWKEVGDVSWALRANPSSGNLHPTEGYLVGGPIEGLHESAVVAHYAPREHALEVRAEVPSELMGELRGEGRAAFFIGLTSIHWREAWKYGERAYRYCQHDVGHAIGAFAVAAAGLGWSVRLADRLGHGDLVRLLDLRPLPDVEPEEPDCLLAVYTGAADEVARPATVPEAFASLSYAGEPNALSHERADWEAVEIVAEAARKPPTEPAGLESATIVAPEVSCLGETLPVRRVVHQRRSAVAFDGRTELPFETFMALLAHTIPSPGRLPFSALPWRPRIHLGLFVHRVTGLAPGLYLFARDPERRPLLQAAMQRPFEWRRPDGVPDGLELDLLMPGDVRAVARGVSCGQDIASDGAFAVAMLAEFEPTLKAVGAWGYPRLHWEAGAIGQVLYLDAEAAGLRATGIGCFFDEPTQHVFGLGSTAFRTVYHFTVGGPVEDERLTTWPPYPPRG